MGALDRKGLAGDVDRVELIMQHGAKFKNKNHIVKDGYLFNTQTGQNITLDGFNKFIMVIRL
jgi:hypothetical protein